MNGCFVCPLYDKGSDFDYAFDMLKSKEQAGVEGNVYFIFSNEQQMKKFRNIVHIGLGLQLDYIVIPDHFEKYKNQITLKKFYGIQLLEKKYDYIAAIDCECRFITRFHMGDVFDSIWKSGSMLTSNKSGDGYFILKKCAETLGVAKEDLLVTETDTFTLNWWFNDIPVYKSEYLKGFFQWLSKMDLDKILNTSECFDYHIFVIYLILKKGFRLKKHDIWSLGGVMEDLQEYYPFERDEIEKTLGTHWTSNVGSKNEQIIMFFHLDRTPQGREQYLKALKHAKRLAYLHINHPSLIIR